MPERPPWGNTAATPPASFSVRTWPQLRRTRAATVRSLGIPPARQRLRSAIPQWPVGESCRCDIRNRVVCFPGRGRSAFWIAKRVCNGDDGRSGCTNMNTCTNPVAAHAGIEQQNAIGSITVTVPGALRKDGLRRRIPNADPDKWNRVSSHACFWPLNWGHSFSHFAAIEHPRDLAKKFASPVHGSMAAWLAASTRWPASA